MHPQLSKPGDCKDSGFVICYIQNPDDKKVTFSPQPDPRLGYVSSSVQTPYGELLSSWKYVNGVVKYKFIIPEGITADIVLPNGEQKTLCGGQILEV